MALPPPLPLLYTGFTMKRNLAPLLLALAGLFLIAGGLGYGWVSSAITNPEAAVLPRRLAGLPLSRADYGAAAVAEVTRMHGRSFLLTSGAHGIYGVRGESATLWVTGAPSRFLAERMVIAMAEAIDTKESPFTPVGVRQIDGRPVYELTGLGQRHYYFRSAAVVIWLGVDEAIAETTLAEVLAFYP
jgi:hypothetical protein